MDVKILKQQKPEKRLTPPQIWGMIEVQMITRLGSQSPML